MPIIPRTKPQPGETVPEEYSDKYTEAVGAFNTAYNRAKKELDILVDNAAQVVAEASGTVIDDMNAAVDRVLAGDVVVVRAVDANKAIEADHADHADRAEEAGIADLALHDNGGRPINEAYARWEDLGPVAEMSTTKPIEYGWKGRSSLSKIPENKTLNQLVSIVVTIRKADEDKVWTFAGIKMSAERSDANGKYVEFHCTQQDVNEVLTNNYTRLRFGTMAVKVYQAQENLYLVVDSGDCVEISIDGWQPQTVVQKNYHDFVGIGYYLTSVRYWFA
jgi:hypothetical protein